MLKLAGAPNPGTLMSGVNTLVYTHYIDSFLMGNIY